MASGVISGDKKTYYRVEYRIVAGSGNSTDWSVWNTYHDVIDLITFFTGMHNNNGNTNREFRVRLIEEAISITERLLTY